MIIVTGTKRSGTSMWMQILRAAGLPVVGTEFPKDWGTVIRAANPAGFFESGYRGGINFLTNPNPQTGQYMHPADVRAHCVKVFIPGLVRTDLAFVDRVIATMRPIRQYCVSLTRLYQMERDNRDNKGLPPLAPMDPALEWWSENYGLVLDHVTRRYPLHLVAYDETLSEPERVIPEAIGWLQVGDADAALKAVNADLRTQHGGPEATSQGPLSATQLEVCDELYERVLGRQPLEVDFIRRLNAVDEELRPAVVEARARAREAMKRRRIEAKRLEAEKAKGSRESS